MHLAVDDLEELDHVIFLHRLPFLFLFLLRVSISQEQRHVRYHGKISNKVTH